MSSTPSRLAAALSDRYTIERELGQGGMATVYLAEDLKHHRQVAIKVLRPELAAVIGAERFLAEIKTTANLQHPHILPLFDSGEVVLQPRTENGERRTENREQKPAPPISVLRSPFSALRSPLSAISSPMPITPHHIRYFPSPAAFRKWLATNHAKADELWVGFHKKHTDKPSLTWPESVDQALCFGWIDGQRRRVDDDRYTIRFTPRRKGSIWSAVNVKRIKELIKEELVELAGLAAFEIRKDHKTAIYSYEKRPEALPEPFEKRFRRHRKAWSYLGSSLRATVAP